MNSRKVVISIKKGFVIDVEAPSDIDIYIRNYDVEEVDRLFLKTDEEGNFYQELACLNVASY